MPTLYSVFKAAGIKQIIWYCGTFAIVENSLIARGKLTVEQGHAGDGGPARLGGSGTTSLSKAILRCGVLFWRAGLRAGLERVGSLWNIWTGMMWRLGERRSDSFM